MKLLSNRLVLRLIESSDLKVIHDLHSRPESDVYNTLGIPEDLGETESIITPWILLHQTSPCPQYTFAIEQASDQGFVGLMALKVGKKKYQRGEVWYKLFAEYWGKGYATEALNRVLQMGFDDLGLHRIEAGCAVANVGSIRVLEKVGMKREGRKRQILPLSSGWSDNYEYAILESDKRGVFGRR